jgi:ADP-ribosylglycohydrolase/fructose-1,6-bisphosphatase/inositol monophosphatase family enzyme
MEDRMRSRNDRSTESPRPDGLLAPALAAVEEAGALLRAEFHRPGGPRGNGSKAEIDEEIENLLKRRLLQVHPCDWLGEETPPVISGMGDMWVVDPQDGTRDFLAGLRGSAISVALLRDGQPVLGIVYAPMAPDDLGDLIAWGEESLITRNGRLITPLDRQEPRVIALNADAADYARHNHATLPGLRVRALPSPAYRLALAAVGEVDAGVSLIQGLAPWDIAGGHALLIGAGHTLTDGAGKPIDYRRPSVDGCIGGRVDTVRLLLATKVKPGRREPRIPARPLKRESDPVTLSRAQGCLLGQLAGDALGSAVEFRHARDIATSHPNGVRQLTDGGTWNTIAGQPTDDGELALALARSLSRNGRYAEEDVAKSYVAWLHSGPFDCGGTTRAGIRALEAGRTASSNSQANGALMRVSPIGIFAAGNPQLAAQLAAQDACMTHPHPRCIAANAAYAAAIAVGIAGADKEQMWSAAYQFAGENSAADWIRGLLNESRQEQPREFFDQMGWVRTAFQNAFYYLLSGSSLEDSVCETVESGGDTDTNGAICAALLGALHGLSAIPVQWKNSILSCRPVKVPGVHRPRPSTYWPDDALELAEAALNRSDFASS